MNKVPYNFNDLFVLDLANNHSGDVEHATNIIRAMGDVVRANGVRAALKFQYRELDTFVHPSHRENSTNKHIPRFLGTRLSRAEFDRLADEVRAAGLITMATPFDELSVDQIVEQGIEILKIASCSAADWPLLEKIAECGKPVIVSTGGLTWKQIDDLVSFFDHRRIEFAIMHCVAIYPTPDEELELSQIERIRERYPSKVVGFSTHELPDALAPVYVAVAKGARILERHVGIETPTVKLNAYSSTPAQVDAWIKAANQAKAICGNPGRQPSSELEMQSLRSLARGVYARATLKHDQPIDPSQVYFAMPCQEGQLTSGQWRAGIVPSKDIAKDGGLFINDVSIPVKADKQIIQTAIHTIKAMLNEARISLAPAFETEFSHHYGIPKFPEFGATLITCVNRSYCKKLIVQLPGQRHPSHYHKTKEETFVVLSGILEMIIEGRRRTLYPGDTMLVQQGVWHEFWSDGGVIFEEISTADVPNDSFYEEKEINRIPRSSRKTRVNQWGRYQL
jgi:sialic acid synthase SpsE/mannose-6-phosphate isomerase-like protein (cupin superfamily)